MTTPIQDIKAGEYELTALLWDEQTSKPGEPFDFVRHVQGDILKLNAEDARRLYAGGAVLPKGERQKLAAAAARAQYEAALAALPDDMRGELDVPPAPVGGAAAGSGGTPPTAPPAAGAKVEEWRAYAVSRGVTAAGAESLDAKAIRALFGV